MYIPQWRVQAIPCAHFLTAIGMMPPRKSTGRVTKGFDPLDDYFLSNSEVGKRVLSGWLDFPFSEEDADFVWVTVRSQAQAYSGLWASSLGSPACRVHPHAERIRKL